MKIINSLLILFFIISLSAKAQDEIGVTHIKSEKNKTITISGDLADGHTIEDLSWAWNSNVACFPETQKLKFSGNHVLYSTNLPEYSQMTITIIPKNKNDDFSIYAYTISPSSSYIVPNLHSCVSCEAEHKWDRPKVNQTQDHTRTLSNLIALKNPYKVIIGVVGANGANKGKFELNIELKSK